LRRKKEQSLSARCTESAAEKAESKNSLYDLPKNKGPPREKAK
jgi:hypothetical protein